MVLLMKELIVLTQEVSQIQILNGVFIIPIASSPKNGKKKKRPLFNSFISLWCIHASFLIVVHFLTRFNC